MILFVLLLIVLVFLVMSLVFAIGLGGSSFIILFGDAIVCAAIIVWIMRRLIKKRKK